MRRPAPAARRVDDDHAFDNGPFVSFANCGLLYHMGNVTGDERALLVASRHTFRKRFNIDVHATFVSALCEGPGDARA